MVEEQKRNIDGRSVMNEEDVLFIVRDMLKDRDENRLNFKGIVVTNEFIRISERLSGIVYGHPNWHNEPIHISRVVKIEEMPYFDFCFHRVETWTGSKYIIISAQEYRVLGDLA